MSTTFVVIQSTNLLKTPFFNFIGVVMELERHI